jgi:hypothetical protein
MTIPDVSHHYAMKEGHDTLPAMYGASRGAWLTPEGREVLGAGSPPVSHRRNGASRCTKPGHFVRDGSAAGVMDGCIGMNGAMRSRS